jgi:hypothetical protein
VAPLVIIKAIGKKTVREREGKVKEKKRKKRI